MADETRNPDRSNTGNYGQARDASQPIRARDFTGSSLCHIIIAASRQGLPLCSFSELCIAE